MSEVTWGQYLGECTSCLDSLWVTPVLLGPTSHHP